MHQWEEVRIPEDIPWCYGKRDSITYDDRQRCLSCKAWSLCTAVVLGKRMAAKAEPVQLEMFDMEEIS